METTHITYENILKNPDFSAKLYSAVGILVLISLQFQTMPLDVGIQMLPLTSIVAVAFLPFILRKIPSSPLLPVLAVFALYAIFHSTVMLLIDLFNGESQFRILVWARQISAFSLGIATVLIMRHVFIFLSLDRFVKTIVYSSIPTLLIGILNVLWGAMSLQWAGAIVTAVRDSLSPYNYTSAFRATGLSTEPASFATTIVLLIIPIILIILRRRTMSVFMVVVIVLSILCLIWTFSSTGIIILLCVLGAGVLFGPHRKAFLMGVFGVVLLLATFIVIFPNNQIVRHAAVISAGASNISFEDRFYSAFGPFLRVFDSSTLLGYGLGGVATNFSDVVPKEVESEIRAVKLEGLPSLASAFGRTYAETGAIGFLLFMLLFAVSFWQIRRLIASSTGQNNLYEFQILQLGLIGTFVAIFITIGPYHTPLLWLWIATIDALYIRRISSVRQVEEMT